jgi:hypothetical protein
LNPDQIPTTNKIEPKPIIARNQSNSVTRKTTVTTKPKIIDTSAEEKKPKAVMPEEKE